MHFNVDIMLIVNIMLTWCVSCPPMFNIGLHVDIMSLYIFMSTSCWGETPCRHHVGDQHHVPIVLKLSVGDYYLNLHVGGRTSCSTLDIMSTSCRHGFQCWHHVADQHHVDLVCLMSTHVQLWTSCRHHVVVYFHVDLMLRWNAMSTSCWWSTSCSTSMSCPPMFNIAFHVDIMSVCSFHVDIMSWLNIMLLTKNKRHHVRAST